MAIYVVDIEPVHTRYTAQWQQHVPNQIAEHTEEPVITISGDAVPQSTTPGAFLNFGGTNVYKSKQMETIASMFCAGEIVAGDYFLFLDAWNPTVIQLKYMSKLLNIPVKIGGLWHAGSYDPQDFLGRLIGKEPWIVQAEKSMFHCYDHNFFATDFHINMFMGARMDWELEDGWYNDHPRQVYPSVCRAGWPMEYLQTELAAFENIPKEDIILFPHRIAPEKQVEIFRDLAQQLPQYEFIVCQDRELTKTQYHELLAKSKIVFSANLQETLGISWYEGVLLGAIPVVPDRLSYNEMALETFRYPSRYTENLSSYHTHRAALCDIIEEFMENYDAYKSRVAVQADLLHQNYFSGTAIYRKLVNG